LRSILAAPGFETDSRSIEVLSECNRHGELTSVHHFP
jgi:hypothetical protein